MDSKRRIVSCEGVRELVEIKERQLNLNQRRKGLKMMDLLASVSFSCSLAAVVDLLKRLKVFVVVGEAR